MISDDQRAAMSKLALKALDTIEEDYGEEATLGDAVVVYEILVPDGEGGTQTHGHYHSTTSRTAPIVGLLEMTATWLKMPDGGSGE